MYHHIKTTHMKKSIIVFLPIALVILLTSVDNVDPEPLPSEQNTFQRIQQDTTFDAEAALAELRTAIKGKEELPAEEVFKNIKIMEGFPAGRVLAIMEKAFNNSLGVSCDHCHNTDQWDSDEKPPKKVTRDMWAMVGTINQDLLGNIEGLESEQPKVNCTTCHRGDVKPALRMKK